MPLSVVCKTRHGGDWTAMDIQTALDNRGAVEMRCPECHGSVRPHKAGTTGQAAHFEHIQSHPGCSFSAHWDKQTKTAHPTPLK